MFLGLVGHKLTAVRRNAKENCRTSAMLQKKCIFIQAAFVLLSVLLVVRHFQNSGASRNRGLAVACTGNGIITYCRKLKSIVWSGFQ